MATTVHVKKPVRRSGKRRPSARRRAATAALGVTATGLIAAGVLLPQLPGGAGLAIDDAASAGPAAQPVTAGTNSVVTSPQMVVPVPAEPAAPTFVVPAPTVRQFDLPRPWVPYGVVPKTSPPPAACGGYSTPRHIPPQVVAGTGSATLSWMADNHSDVQGYRVRAVSQQLVTGAQPEPPGQDVAQVGGCGTVTATMTGLTSGVYYVFWLEEAQHDTSNGVVRYVQVGESDPMLIG
jgi:hypothetical protein